MRDPERLIAVLRSVNANAFYLNGGAGNFTDRREMLAVIYATASALEMGLVNAEVVGAIRNNIDRFTSPHIAELLTEALHYLEEYST